jgi:hypothetical protein
MERRQHLRQSVRRPATIGLGGSDTMPCQIRDVSRGGARLEVPGASWVSYALDLRDVMTGAMRKCAVVWRDETTFGVAFVDNGDWPKSSQRRVQIQFGRRLRDSK